MLWKQNMKFKPNTYVECESPWTPDKGPWDQFCSKLGELNPDRPKSEPSWKSSKKDNMMIS